MAKYRVRDVEERTDGDIACDTFVLVEKDDGEGGTVDVVIGHFTVVLRSAEVLALAGLPKAQRVAGYKALFSADPRIQVVPVRAMPTTQAVRTPRKIMSSSPCISSVPHPRRC